MVKICGLRSSEMSIRAAAAGADLLGFIFAPSRRQVSAPEVAAIIGDVRRAGYATPAVGVFVDPDPEQLKRDVAMSGIDLVQLAGDENPADYMDSGLAVIKAIPAGEIEAEAELRSLIHEWSFARYILLDAQDPGARGGTGKLANWELCRRIAQDVPVLLAGGLSPENVSEAVATVEPFGVDVSSGVETNGTKDSEKIDQFVRQARASFGRANRE
jgi:phosphoribosylanthranilate isomerase